MTTKKAPPFAEENTASLAEFLEQAEVNGVAAASVLVLRRHDIAMITVAAYVLKDLVSQRLLNLMVKWSRRAVEATVSEDTTQLALCIACGQPLRMPDLSQPPHGIVVVTPGGMDITLENCDGIAMVGGLCEDCAEKSNDVICRKAVPNMVGCEVDKLVSSMPPSNAIN